MPTVAPIRVMIVDDHPVTRSSLKLLLFFEPDIVVVGTATCITEAFALAPQVQPEVVLMDVQLPDGDGITAAKQVQSILPTTHLILMSVQSDHPGLQPALQAGRWTFLLKPVEAQTLYRAIRNAVGPRLPRTVAADQTACDRPTDPAHDALESLPTAPSSPPVAVQPAPTCNRVRAYQLTRQRLLADPRDVQAWIWMSRLVDDCGQQRACLERALALDPYTAEAHAALETVRLHEILAATRATVALSAPEPGKLGTYLIEQGILTEAHVQAALAEQRARSAAGTPTRLGDLLIQRGWLTPQALANSVALQDDTQQQAAGCAGPARLGTYLLRHGFITPDQLEATLWLQVELRYKGQPILLGELLIRLGYVTPEAVAAALEQ